MTKLVKHKKTGRGDIVEKTEKKILASYLLQLRKIFEIDNQIKDVIINNVPAKTAKSKLIELLVDRCKPDSSDLFEQAIDIILNELDEFREKPSSLYLIDKDTGMTIMPISDKVIYTPPDYIGEDGKLHKSKPMLHPGIAASLALTIYSETKLKRYLKKAIDPISEQAYRHLSGPEQILRMAKDRLNHIGIKINNDSSKCNQIIEFGKEQVEGIMQSPNIHFHRAHMFAAILAHKILELGGRSAKYFIGPIENKKNSKYSWYTVKIGIDK